MTATRAILTDLARETGVCWTAPGAVRQWARVTAPPALPGPMSPEEFVAQARRAGAPRADWRLTAAGLGVMSPRSWAVWGLGAFAAYWARAATRPQKVGSSYNPPPAAVARAWATHVPSGVVRYLGVAPLCRGPEAVARGEVRGISPRRMRTLARAARAMRRSSSGGGWAIPPAAPAYTDRPRSEVPGARPIAVKTLAALGRLSPELQRAALTAPLGGQGPVRVRDLNWALVARAQAQLARNPAHRGLWAVGARQGHLLGQIAPGAICPAYPGLPIAAACAIARGQTPVQLAQASGDALTRAEAHAWCLSGAPSDVAGWWWEMNASPALREAVVGVVPREIGVAKWIVAIHGRGQWVELTRRRTMRAPGGAPGDAPVEYRLVDRLDEIQAVDLDRGPGTPVQRAFERAAERVYRDSAAGQAEDHTQIQAWPADWARPLRAMEHLATPARIVQEGAEQGHCVGGYVPLVRRGQCVIVGIRLYEVVDGLAVEHRSTVELALDRSVRQHKGPGNGEPHRLCRAVLRVWMAR